MNLKTDLKIKFFSKTVLVICIGVFILLIAVLFYFKNSEGFLQSWLGIPSQKQILTETQLKYRLIDKYNEVYFCDPDEFPVARGNEQEIAIQNFDEILKNREEFETILERTHLNSSNLTDSDKLLIYKEYKKLNSIMLDSLDDGYKFTLRYKVGSQVFAASGFIEKDGKIIGESKQLSSISCPICLSYSTQIETPKGSIFIQAIKPGDKIWTVDLSGRRIEGKAVLVSKTKVPTGFKIAHLVLSDGRELFVSGGHPTFEGKKISDLLEGDIIDGASLILKEFIPYNGSYTFDILPSGPTGAYWANKILIKSSLANF